MVSDLSLSAYGWSETTPHTQDYLLPSLARILNLRCAAYGRVLDLGCGNGALCHQLSQWGYGVIGVDPSATGIAIARNLYPNLEFHQVVPTPEALTKLKLSDFDLVISTEVVEHCFAPRDWAASAYKVLKPGGIFICSTPYHGYFKNLALALSGQLDAHFTALWDGGHIKFWSRATLTQLLQEAGFVQPQFAGAGRLPWLWKSMLLSVHKPEV